MVRAFACIALLTWYAWLAHAQVKVWQSELMLWRHAVQVAPLNARAHVNYAKALFLTGDIEEVRRQVEIADVLERAK